MGRRLVGAVIAVAALNALVATTVNAADDICSVEISECYIDGGKKTCDRENAVCPPCLAEMSSGFLDLFTSTKYACYQLNDDSECPKKSQSCPATTPSPSPTPTPKKTPKKTPSKTSSSSGSSDSSSSSSGSSTPKPSKTKKASSSSSSSGSSSSSSSITKTPKPTPSPTPKPTPSPTPKPTPSPTPTPTTASPQVSQASSPTNANAADNDDSSGSSIGLILAIAGGSVVVVAVLAFFVWKRRQDDDDDSDDDEPRYPPKSNYNHAATSTAYAAGAAPTAFSKPVAAPYNTNVQAVPGQMVTSPGHNNQTYAIPVAGPIVDYDSPSNVDRSQRSFYVDAPSQGGYRLSDPESHSSSEGSRDVWGNTVGSYREKRTHSNVSVEF